MAASFALPVIPGGTGILAGGTGILAGGMGVPSGGMGVPSGGIGILAGGTGILAGGMGILPVSTSRPSEAPKFGRERAGAVRPGFHRLVMDDLRSAYLSDQRPWVVGFSGGKDSTCLMQLVCYMLARLPAKQRAKPVYVLASDTRVEAPSISRRIRKELALLSAAAGRIMHEPHMSDRPACRQTRRVDRSRRYRYTATWS